MYEIKRSSGFGSLVEVVLFLTAIAFFLMVVTTILVVRTFVKYHTSHKSLWLALAGCVGSCFAAGLVYKLTQFQGSFSIVALGIVWLLLNCLIVELKERETLMRPNIDLMDEVLRKPWDWGSETPLQETEQDQLAA